MMQEVRLNDAERACAKILAELFEADPSRVYFRQDRDEDDEVGPGPDDPLASLKLSPEKWHAVLATMEQFGIICNVMHGDGYPYFRFETSAKSLQVARAIKAAEEEAKTPEDVLEQIKIAAKRKPYIAWGIIVVIGLTALVTFINQLLDLLTKLGVRH